MNKHTTCLKKQLKYLFKDLQNEKFKNYFPNAEPLKRTENSDQIFTKLNRTTDKMGEKVELTYE